MYKIWNFQKVFIQILNWNLLSCFGHTKWQIQGGFIIVPLPYRAGRASKQAASWFLPPLACLGLKKHSSISHFEYNQVLKNLILHGDFIIPLFKIFCNLFHFCSHIGLNSLISTLKPQFWWSLECFQSIQMTLGMIDTDNDKIHMQYFQV